MSDNGKDTNTKIATRGEILGQRCVIIKEKTNLSASTYPYIIIYVIKYF
jgi:hypothetical protein